MSSERAGACYKRLVYHGRFPLLYVDNCNSNYELGVLVGQTFSNAIKQRVAASLAFKRVEAYCATNWGKQLLLALKETHRTAFPAYWQEMAGLAAGSGLPFDHIVMLNLRQEILAASEVPELERQRMQERVEQLLAHIQLHGPDAAAASATASSRTTGHGTMQRSGGNAAGAGGADSSAALRGGAQVDPSQLDACSDVLLQQRAEGEGAPRILVGHNEDMTNDTLGRVYFIRATMEGRPSWFALTYAGELPSTAFGANTAGVAFTLDALYPSQVQLPGLGRNFLSRAMLDAPRAAAALGVLQSTGQATGRSVNLMDLHTPAVYNVEIGPGGTYDVMPVTDNTWYFHANSYLRLPVPQKVDNSSLHRVARAAQFAMPATPEEILNILGDKEDPDFPIYREGDYGGLVYTLCTVLFDLSRMNMLTYAGNPKDGHLAAVLNLYTLVPRALEDAGTRSEPASGDAAAEAAGELLVGAGGAAAGRERGGIADGHEQTEVARL